LTNRKQAPITVKILSGGQSGVDRAALDAAISLGITYGGWCPRGGWAEDFPDPPGLLVKYPQLVETPLADPAQRTEWNIRDSHAVLILVDAAGVTASRGTTLAKELAAQYRRPTLLIDLSDASAGARVDSWLGLQLVTYGEELVLGIGGPRESEAPGIYERAKKFLAGALERS